MRAFIIVMLATILAACATKQPAPDNSNRASTSTSVPSGNPYADTFVAHPVSDQVATPDPAGPKIYQGRDKTADYNSLLAQGYDMAGYSSFEGGDVGVDKLQEQARRVKADTVLVYTQQVGSTPSSVKLQQMRDAMMKQKQGGIAEEEKPTGGDAASAESADQARYSYFASYWVKLAPPAIGVHVNADNGSSGERGLPVVAVIRSSPAEKAGLMNGDVLTQLGDITLDKPERLLEAAKKYAGQTVIISYNRSGAANQTDITLNRKP